MGRAKKLPTHIVEWNDTKYPLAIIGKGRDIPEKEKLKIAEVVCLIYSENKYPILDCLEFCGISETTWRKWKEEIPQIADLYKKAYETKSANRIVKLRELALTQLEKRLTGEIKEVIEEIGEPIKDSEGNVTGIKTVAYKKKQIFLKPSDMLIAMTLINTDPANFERNPKGVEKMNKEVDIDPIEWVD